MFGPADVVLAIVYPIVFVALLMTFAVRRRYQRLLAKKGPDKANAYLTLTVRRMRNISAAAIVAAVGTAFFGTWVTWILGIVIGSLAVILWKVTSRFACVVKTAE